MNAQLGTDLGPGVTMRRGDPSAAMSCDPSRGSRLDRRRPIPQLHSPVAAAASKAPGIRLPARLACGPCQDRHRETRQEAARILRDEVCNRSADTNPPLELLERTEQILASRDWLAPEEVGKLSRVALRIVKVF